MRNEFVFEGKNVPISDIPRRVYFLAVDYHRAQIAVDTAIDCRKVYKEKLVAWTPNDWCKLNTDGSIVQHSGSAACGGILHDSSGNLAAYSATSAIALSLWLSCALFMMV